MDQAEGVNSFYAFALQLCSIYDTLLKNPYFFYNGNESFPLSFQRLKVLESLILNWKYLFVSIDIVILLHKNQATQYIR